MTDLRRKKWPYSLDFITYSIQSVKYNIISNVMGYTMLCMLEWMRKGKHRIGTLRTRGLRGSALTAYIHGGIP